MPMVGIEGGRVNIVPVDFVVDALDHIAHKKGLDGGCFHLTDPIRYRVGEVLNIFARPRMRPQMTLRVNAALFGFIPAPVSRRLMALTPVRRMMRAVLKDLGLPEDVLPVHQLPDALRQPRDALPALKGSGIACPRPARLRLGACGTTGSATSTPICSSTAAARRRWPARWC
jgi:hypothetical protein